MKAWDWDGLGEIVQPCSTICLSLIWAFRIAGRWRRRKICLSASLQIICWCDRHSPCQWLFSIFCKKISDFWETFSGQVLEEIFQVAIVWFCPRHQLPPPPWTTANGAENTQKCNLCFFSEDVRKMTWWNCEINCQAVCFCQFGSLTWCRIYRACELVSSQCTIFHWALEHMKTVLGGRIFAWEV